MAFEFGEFKNFVDMTKKLSKEYPKFLEEFLLKCAMDALAKTKKRTPVDTGELRRNWQVTNVIRRGDNFEITIFNNKNYASFLEYGHTTRDRKGWVEGYYMATVTMEEINSKIPARHDREFQKFCKSLGF